MTNIQNYDDALAFIHGRTKFKKIPTLKRMRRFLKELGNGLLPRRLLSALMSESH